MEKLKEKHLSSNRIHEGQIINLRVDTVQLPNGVEATREIVEHPGAVSIIALNDNNEIILEYQYRAAVGEVIIEIPAGKLDKGEGPDMCARRELEEETGLVAGRWEKIFTFYTTPGFSDEIMYLYLARDLKESEQSLDEDEFVEIVTMPVEEALAMCKNGRIKDAKTIIGITAASLYLNSQLL